jgi:hypothetical protein
MPKPNPKLAKKKENPSCTIERRPNVGSTYNDRTKPLPLTEVVGKASNLDAAIQQVKQTGDKSYVYKIFQNKNLVKELCWSDNHQWHKPMGFTPIGCYSPLRSGLRIREGKKFIEEYNRVL